MINDGYILNNDTGDYEKEIINNKTCNDKNTKT